MNINDFLGRIYGPQPCWELVVDALQSAGMAAPLEFKTVNRSVRQMASEFRIALYKGQHGYIEIATPENMCIVLLGKSDCIGITHCGIYQDGSVLHALPGIVLFEQLSVIRDRFEIVQFWNRA